MPVPVAGVGAAAGDRDCDSVRAAVYVRTVVRIVILSVPALGAETDRPERVHYNINDMGGGCSLQGWPRRPRAQQGAAGDRDRVCDVYVESRWIGVRLRGSR